MTDKEIKIQKPTLHTPSSLAFFVYRKLLEFLKQYPTFVSAHIRLARVGGDPRDPGWEYLDITIY